MIFLKQISSLMTSKGPSEAWYRSSLPLGEFAVCSLIGSSLILSWINESLLPHGLEGSTDTGDGFAHPEEPLSLLVGEHAARGERWVGRAERSGGKGLQELPLVGTEAA